MTRLARANRVLYIEPWPYLRPTLRKLRDGRIRLAELAGPCLEQVNPNLHVYRPARWAPRAGRSPLASVAEAIYMVLLRSAIRRLRFCEPILWLFLPDMAVFAGRFGEKLVIYHMVDEYTGYSGVSEAWRPVMRRMEAQLARVADLVFVSSPTLLESKRSLNEHMLWVANAVDFDTFASAAVGRDGLPPDLANLPSPIMGYVGAINEKVDLSLLVSLAATFPAWSLVLAGPVRVSDSGNRSALEVLQGMPNVHFLGQKDVTLVPKYISAFDVCLLPYRINEWTRHIDSLKLYEYLACGKPVVATNVPAAQRFSDVVSVAESSAAFVAAVRDGLRGDDAELQAKRRGVAAQNTWERRIDAISAMIEERLSERREPGDRAEKER